MNQELKVLFFCKKNKQKQGEASCVMCRITVGRTMAQLSCKLEVDAQIWDVKSGRMGGKSKAAQEINRKIDKLNLLINTRYQDISKSQGNATAQQVKNAVQGIASSQDTVLDYFATHNEAFAKRVGVDRTKSTFKKYRIAFAHLQTFLGLKYNLTDIPFKALNYSFIEKFDFYLRIEKRQKPNSVLRVVVPLRRIVRLAINKGVISRDPFDGYSPQGSVSKRKTLTYEELSKIMALELHFPQQSISRDMFVFSCWTGLSYIDVKNLTASKIVTMEDGRQWIITNRQKTGTASNVRLMDIPLAIIEKYRDRGVDGKLFPMPASSTVDLSLKTIDELCSIGKALSYHQSRHTFASLIMLSEGVPIETVSRMLGHKDIHTTQIYAEVSHEKIAQDMKVLSSQIAGKYTLID